MNKYKLHRKVERILHDSVPETPKMIWERNGFGIVNPRSEQENEDFLAGDPDSVKLGDFYFCDEKGELVFELDPNLK